MKLVPLDSPALIELVAGWLSACDDYKWLDFGGTAPPTPALLRIMAQRDANVLRVFTADDDATPIGVVGLSEIDHYHKTATVWAVVGDKARARCGYTARAVSRLLTLGFRDLGLGTIQSWSVEHNRPGLAITKRLNFRYVGRQRQCHRMDGRAYDRLIFDLLASEHEEL